MMVFTSTTYNCDECRKTYFDYDEARVCEGQHIVDRAVEGIRAKLDEIMGPARKIVATMKPATTPSGKGE
jgi:hypothetical protein